MKPVLILIDLQEDYLNAPGLQPPHSALVASAASLLKQFRERNLPVIHVHTTVDRHTDRRLPHWKEANRWICESGTSGHRPPGCLQPAPGERVIHKAGFNAFHGTEFDDALRDTHCDTAILAGVHLHACVRSVATECLERAYQVRVAEDAVGSNDPVHAAATRRWLSERCVRFVPSADVLSEGISAARIVHRSPRNGDILFEVPISGDTEVERAISVARDASKSWQPLEVLERVAHLLSDCVEDLARQMALEIGKPITQGREEMARAVANVRDVVQRASVFQSVERLSEGLVRHRPHGVVAIITPWNNPIAIPIGKIAPALAYGNSVVWKPSPAGTRIGQALMEVLLQAGVPSGAVQLVTGDHSAAQRLADSAGVDAVSFTGSLQAGRAMQEICARRMRPLQAELNGNNAAIVWDDADLSHAAQEVARGAFAFAGQRCTANRRVIVPGSMLEQFSAQLLVAGSRLQMGDPCDPATDIGPMISSLRREQHEAMLDEATVVAVRVTGDLHNGAYARPAIVRCDDPEHPLVQEETMSPLLVIQPARSFEHALELCNGVRYGLAAALFSPSRELQNAFLAGANAGILKLNSSTAGADITLPFGGWKASGIGPPEHGDADRLFYTSMQAVYGAS